MTYRQAEYPHIADLMTSANCADDTDVATFTVAYVQKVSVPLSVAHVNSKSASELMSNNNFVAQIETIRHS